MLDRGLGKKARQIEKQLGLDRLRHKKIMRKFNRRAELKNGKRVGVGSDPNKVKGIQNILKNKKAGLEKEVLKKGVEAEINGKGFIIQKLNINTSSERQFENNVRGIKQ